MDEELLRILKYLPEKASLAVRGFAEELGGKEAYISEIRLRANAPLSVSYGARNISSFRGRSVICDEYEVAETLQKLCEDSVHTYGETLKEGFISLENGYRIGVCGRVGVSGDSIRSVYGISSLSIRIPHAVRNVAGDMKSLLLRDGGIESALFYAPPNVGKTTLIRDLAAQISGGSFPRRVALIDTRGELYIRRLFVGCLVDVLHGYPRAKGIEIATRTLSPEVIFCDEIGSAEEARAILGAQNSGVPLIATAHADGREALFRRPNIRLLYENGIFRYYIGIRRNPEAGAFDFDVFDTAETLCATSST
ncbi:MAG: AAA family ATPase [Clostridia bacterium]|nr:AAA family ATPase [Clostridia bacterium]